MAGQDAQLTPRLLPSYLSVMRELFLAWQLAVEAGRPQADFAVEIDAFTKLGATHAEIRYLLCKGYVEHRIDSTLSNQVDRLALPTESLRLTAQSCLLLTREGVELATRLFNSDNDPPPAPNGDAMAGPHWDSEQRILEFNGQVVQRFERRAPVQEQILQAFEEEGWTWRIDDPLPPNGDVDRKMRLNKTIHRLNTRLQSKPIQFCSDGTGEGICWHKNGAADFPCDNI